MKFISIHPSGRKKTPKIISILSLSKPRDLSKDASGAVGGA
jgi:hypothetical protein